MKMTAKTEYSSESLIISVLAFMAICPGEKINLAQAMRYIMHVKFSGM